MTKDQVDELMRENGIVVVGEAVYILCNLVEAESAAAEREACADMVLTLTCMGNAKECFEVAATYIRARGVNE